MRAALGELHVGREGPALASALCRCGSGDGIDPEPPPPPPMSTLDRSSTMQRASSSLASRLEPEWLAELDISPDSIKIREGEDGTETGVS